VTGADAFRDFAVENFKLEWTGRLDPILPGLKK
jgi:hypothetical protein